MKKLVLSFSKVLPLSASHRALSVSPPKESSIEQRPLAAQHVGHILTIQRITRLRFSTRGGDHRRCPVHRDDRLIADYTRRRNTGPSHNSRDADPAFMEIHFLSGKGPVVRESLAAVVTCENDQRVFL